ncbi:MAG TPA: CTP-dependent riboflavin kinase [Methanothermococcus okinawensis]|nr:CTP-dependent riboflavin kinase [Methanothermococcus okinawensis]
MPVLYGRVTSGKGEGRYYMSLKPYRKKFKSVLGYYPYEGTLNIKLSEYIPLDMSKCLEIEGFEYKGERYYGVKLLPAKVSKDEFGIYGALIFPEKSHHPKNIVEIISPLNLRNYLSLKNGDVVKILVE